MRYYRRNYRGIPIHDPSLRDIGTVTFWLLAANIAVFLLDDFLFHGDLMAAGGLYYPAVESGERYRLLTAAFLHSGITHIGYNMISLFVLGFALEEAMGHVRFAAVYLAAAVLGNRFVLFMEQMRGVHHFTVGASGAIFGLMGAWLAISLNRHDGMRGLPIGRLIVSCVLMFLPGFNDPSISMSGHLGGFIFGFLAALIIGFLFPVRGGYD